MSIIINTLTDVVKRFPDRLAFIHGADDGFHHIPYRLFQQAAATVSADLAERGCRPGDRVVLLAGYGPKWCAAYMGIHETGCTAVPLNAQYSKDDVQNILAFVDPVAELTDADYRSLLPDGVGSCRFALMYKACFSYTIFKKRVIFRPNYQILM